jgi:hypothetical protein
MPKRRIAWSCWNYLSFTKAIPLPAGQEEDGYSSNEDLYDDKGKHPKILNIQEVEQVSLSVFNSLLFSLLVFISDEQKFIRTCKFVALYKWLVSNQ